MKRALVSVSDKTNLVSFVQNLVELGYEIISTGGTKKTLEEAGINVIAIDEVTGFPEILEGRVKTLHPLVHGGLLAKRNDAHHQEQVKENNIEYIDLVCVNLYPFAKTIQNPEATHEDKIENIDIGGPSMLRSAAKNFNDVTVVVDANDYDLVISEIREQGNTTLKTRQMLAGKVFNHTASYDAMIANYFNEINEIEVKEKLTVTYDLKQTLRYGENPHQHAAFYKRPLGSEFSIAYAEQLHGKELSYNNIHDADAALQLVKDFDEPAAIAVKHMNPCGVGVGKDANEAFAKAYEADPTSIFGGIIAFNREVDAATATQLHEIFLEIVIAPSFTQEALEILTAKKNIRLLTIDFNQLGKKEKMLTSIEGGLLVQDQDAYTYADADITVPTKRQPTEEEVKALQLAWKVVKHVKSNAIVVGNEQMTLGVGAGQMNRVGAAKIALEQAGDRAKGAVLASDAFFPMGDTVEAAAKAGITAIIQPGGSIRDEESIKVCDEYGIAMIFTGVRHFKH